MFKVKALFLSLLLFSPVVSSATYTWVDENGVTHYSQTKPNSGNYTIVKPTTRYPSAQSESSAKPATKPTEPTKQPQQTQPPVAEVTLDEEQCQRLKADLDTLLTSPRIRLKTGDEYKYLTEEEKQAMIDERRDLIKKHCE